MAEEERVHRAFAETWAKSRPTVEARIGTIERALAKRDQEGLDEPMREEAIREAHRLAGLLGTFGLGRGSELARELEEGLAAGGAPRAARLRGAAEELRLLVTGARLGAS